MISKKDLQEIGGLRLRAKLGLMSDNDYNEYCGMLDKFIDYFPIQEAALKNHFKSSNFGAFSGVLTEMTGTLASIYADDLVKRCEKLNDDIKNPNRDMAEASLAYSLTAVSMLSIEIQMAKHKNEVYETPVPAAPSPVSEPVPAAATSDKVVQKSILAVDDVALLLSTLRTTLQNTEYKFTGVTSGDAALKYLQIHKPDLFLLDIEMPGMNGYELALKIKAAGHKAPIVFLTGNARSEDVMRAIQVGASDFIVKPVNKEQVLEKIKKFIG